MNINKKFKKKNDYVDFKSKNWKRIVCIYNDKIITMRYTQNREHQLKTSELFWFKKLERKNNSILEKS